MAKHGSRWAAAGATIVVLFAVWTAQASAGEDVPEVGDRRALSAAGPGWMDHTLVFYVDETKTAVVANNRTGYEFGTLTVWRSKITSGPEPNSECIGQIEGMNAFTGDNKHLVSSTMEIKTEDFEGSISLLGTSSSAWKAERRYPVVGGTGSFLYVRGMATFKQAKPGHMLAEMELCLRFDA